MHMQMDGQTDRQTDRQTDTQTDRQTDMQASPEDGLSAPFPLAGRLHWPNANVLLLSLAHARDR